MWYCSMVSDEMCNFLTLFSLMHAVMGGIGALTCFAAPIKLHITLQIDLQKKIFKDL